jgi:hypothetical protein
VAFFGLQAVIPACFAIVPVVVFLIGVDSLAGAARKLTDGTLVLIAFTMLISLSQDLRPAVKPYHREYAAKLELVLRIAAIVILAVYTLFQSTSMIIIFKESNCIDATEKCMKLAYETISPHRSVRRLDLLLSAFSFICFMCASALSLRVLYVLRPYLTDRN